jgi:hypothetical protein
MTRSARRDHSAGLVRSARMNTHSGTSWVSHDRQRDILELQKFLFQVADNTDRELMMQVIVDEVQDIAPQDATSGDLEAVKAVRRFCKRGVKRNIKFVAITQDPTAYDKQALRQSEYRLIFDMANENRKSSVLRKMGFDWGAVDATPDRYTGVLHDDSGTVLDEDVKAEARFA